MVVAVTVMRVMQPPGDQVVDVIAVRDRVVPAAVAMGVRRVAVGRLGVTAGVRVVDGDRVLVHMVLVRMVQMPVMQVVDVILVAHGRVAAAVAMDMGVSGFVDRVRHRTTVAAAWPHAKHLTTRIIPAWPGTAIARRP